MDDQWVTHDVEVAGVASEQVWERWLLTNGTGAYAMGTVAGVNTHRYHGLFIAAVQPPVERVMALNQMFERLELSDGEDGVYEPSTCLFRGSDGQRVFAPRGHEMLSRFRKGLGVEWHYELAGVRFVRQLYIHWKQQAVTLRYRIEGLAQDAKLFLHPMLTLRDFHGLMRFDDHDRFDIDGQGEHITVRAGQTAVTLNCPRGRFEASSDTWQDVYYPIDAERGQDDQEDYHLPGRFDVRLKADAGPQQVDLTVSLGRRPQSANADTGERATHLSMMAGHFGGGGRTRQMLVMAADDFVVDRRVGDDELSTILAGYPWFADWGRDTFIALPGLMLATGRFDEARATLRAFADAIQGGLVPNRFDDYDEAAAHFNSVDASLWFVHAAVEYVRESNDRDAWEDWLAASLVDIIDAFMAGTRFDIAMAADGLIAAGSPQTQLTWMDAATGGVVFTPRWGKAVEINALWHHGLVAVGKMIREEDESIANRYMNVAERAKQAFVNVFWDEAAGYLRDHVKRDEEGNEHADFSLRPNQIIAVSVEHSPLPGELAGRVVAMVRDHLLTPYGLRTLPVDDPNYHGRYTGGAFDRDRAYHQGTVWPWLIGPYAEAVLRAGNFEAAACDEARIVFEPLLRMMRAFVGRAQTLAAGTTSTLTRFATGPFLAGRVA